MSSNREGSKVFKHSPEPYQGEQPMGLCGVHHILDSLERNLWQKKLLLMWNTKTPSF